jgi:DNA-3-methyladenine glycosylase I
VTTRCSWAKNEPAIAYHDREWGAANHDDAVHFEFLTLEAAQAGLSWDIILRKRERYREVFAQFDAARVARFTPARIERLTADAGIVRNRRKIEAAVANARAFLQVREQFGSFDAYVWRFVGGTPLRGHWRRAQDVPASTPVSDALSKDLRARGFSFVGTTICYSFMQAVGMADDHLVTCFKYRA